MQYNTSMVESYFMLIDTFYYVNLSNLHYFALPASVILLSM